MSEPTVAVLRRHRTTCPVQDCEWCAELDCVIAAVAELIEATRPAITEEGMDQAELDRLREAFARVGGAE
ncbi:hypothetical protein [Lysobacter enzymogenes]|uniref:hypothetical protein n=1 Tax=Lysobacter enzymogenes TaxID=69 RepID=UPI0019D280EA|nr:hypothetical protein [Lysobacter enzymogenes]